VIKRRSVVGVALVASAALGLAACSSSSGGSGGSSGGGATTITIANVTDLSGVQQPLGTDENKGLEFAVQQINAAGGVKSMGGAKIVVKRYDTASSPDNAVTQATKAVQDGANIVIGGEISDIVIAGSNVTHRAGIPWISIGGTASQVTGRGFNDVFQVCTNSDQLSQQQYDVMKFTSQQLGLTPPVTMGLSISDTTYGNNLNAGFNKANSDGFFKIINQAKYPLGTADLSPIAARMIQGNPSVLYNEGYPTDGLNLGKLFADKFQTTAKILLTTATYSVVQKELGAKGNGMIMGAGPSPAFKGMPDSFTTTNAAYKAVNGVDMSPSAVTGYIAARVTYEALEAGKSAKGSDLAAAIHKVNLTHDQGNLWPQDTVSFQDNGSLKDISTFQVQLQNAQIVGIFPESVAAAKPIPYR
jgi:branched-chain amino acid transport system substrate-binding protein